MPVTSFGPIADGMAINFYDKNGAGWTVLDFDDKNVTLTRPNASDDDVAPPLVLSRQAFDAAYRTQAAREKKPPRRAKNLPPRLWERLRLRPSVGGYSFDILGFDAQRKAQLGGRYLLRFRNEKGEIVKQWVTGNLVNKLVMAPGASELRELAEELKIDLRSVDEMRQGRVRTTKKETPEVVSPAAKTDQKADQKPEQPVRAEEQKETKTPQDAKQQKREERQPSKEQPQRQVEEIEPQEKDVTRTFREAYVQVQDHPAYQKILNEISTEVLSKHMQKTGMRVLEGPVGQMLAYRTLQKMSGASLKQTLSLIQQQAMREFVKKEPQQAATFGITVESLPPPPAEDVVTFIAQQMPEGSLSQAVFSAEIFPGSQGPGAQDELRALASVLQQSVLVLSQQADALRQDQQKISQAINGYRAQRESARATGNMPLLARLEPQLRDAETANQRLNRNLQDTQMRKQIEQKRLERFHDLQERTGGSIAEMTPEDRLFLEEFPSYQMQRPPANIPSSILVETVTPTRAPIPLQKNLQEKSSRGSSAMARPPMRQPIWQPGIRISPEETSDRFLREPSSLDRDEYEEALASAAGETPGWPMITKTADEADTDEENHEPLTWEEMKRRSHELERQRLAAIRQFSGIPEEVQRGEVQDTEQAMNRSGARPMTQIPEFPVEKDETEEKAFEEMVAAEELEQQRQTVRAGQMQTLRLADQTQKKQLAANKAKEADASFKRLGSLIRTIYQLIAGTIDVGIDWLEAIILYDWALIRDTLLGGNGGTLPGAPQTFLPKKYLAYEAFLAFLLHGCACLVICIGAIIAFIVLFWPVLAPAIELFAIYSAIRRFFHLS